MAIECVCVGAGDQNRSASERGGENEDKDRWSEQGGEKKQRKMERENARGEYEFIELTLQSLVLFCRERQFEKIKQSQDVL